VGYLSPVDRCACFPLTTAISQRSSLCTGSALTVKPTSPHSVPIVGCYRMSRKGIGLQRSDPMCKVMWLAFSLTLALLFVHPASAQPRCTETDLWANGTPATLKTIARRNARAAWLARARGELGETYATWSNAKGPRITCPRTQRMYTCTVSARACRA